VTPAVRVLKGAGVEYSEHFFDYVRHPGAGGAARVPGVETHLTAKTIVFVTEVSSGVVVLMHGDKEVSTKKLARVMGVKSARPATEEEGRQLTGYQFGGTSPLGMRREHPVLAEETLIALETVDVSRRQRGFHHRDGSPRSRRPDRGAPG
jgi:Cys-tRNA(Pro) deacylase